MNTLKTALIASFILLTAFKAGIAAEPPASAEERFRSAYITETTDRDLERAVSQYLSVVNDTTTVASIRSESWYRLGLCYERLGRGPDALEAYRSAIASDSNSSRPYIESAKTGLQRLEVGLRPAFTPEIKPTLKRGQKFFTPVHQLLLVGGSGTLASGGSSGFGLELFGYE